ncbi:phosphoglycerate mutase-like protein 4 isoform X1 [Beta vulgaris subsp. vulgaris]|uniref:phosphoglycerate mutase-like protein 4 isoform X1 n=1 Tax=Beta vulgaris subsp. vulgaris TaxID=3555 RepID=UPI00203710FA|nr:phosphoglycerate mutase-like protein 4 isoform X1 [Beta vulgaris subsp. vulgaris]
MECIENGIVGKDAELTNGSSTEIIVVRHGETEWNALGKMQGQMDIDLNNVGRQQAITVAERLSREPNISAIYSSDLKRALETAQTIASRCVGLQVITDVDLRERHIGDLQGLVFRESSKINPVAFEALKSPKSDQEIPGGGESRDQLYKRCTSSLQRIAEKHRGERVVAVTHGAVIEMLYKRAIPGGKAGGVMNTSVSIIQLSKEDVWSIKLWNDISHLKETEFLESAAGGSDSSG